MGCKPQCGDGKGAKSGDTGLGAWEGRGGILVTGRPHSHTTQTESMSGQPRCDEPTIVMGRYEECIVMGIGLVGYN